MVVLSRETFDAIEFEAAYSGDHQAAAQQMTHLADTGIQTSSMPRPEAYVRAGDQWLLADDPAAAAQSFLRALEDGGPASVDPRSSLARALFMLGRGDDAEALLHQLELEAPQDARACDLLAELLVERGDLPRALAWATAGVDLCLGRAPGPVAEWQVPEQAAGESRNGHGRNPQARRPGSPGSPNRQDPPGPAARHHLGPQRQGESPSVPRPLGPSDIRAGTTVPPARRDDTELRLLLSLRFRVRNDLGLPEDSYDRLLDRMP